MLNTFFLENQGLQCCHDHHNNDAENKGGIVAAVMIENITGHNGGEDTSQRQSST